MVQKDGIGFGVLSIYNSSFDIDTGWFFLERKPWIIYLRLFNQSSLPRPSHCHQDFGSPVIFHKKKELIIDPGRSSYVLDQEPETNALKHSTFLINNEPLAYSERDLKFFPIPIRSYKFKKYVLGETVYLLIRFPLSLNSSLKIKYALRLLVIKERSIEIVDRISLLKESTISTRFNFSFPLNKFSKLFSYRIDKDKSKNILIGEESKELCISHRSLDYNSTNKYISFNFRVKTKNTFCSRFLISE